MKLGHRRHDRFVLLKRAFAALGHDYTKIGKIKDIGLGGLAFEYFTGESGQTDVCEVDIFLADNVFQLYNIPCEIIYDSEVRSTYVNSCYSQRLSTKRCGLAFLNLSADETSRLKLFLQAYSAGLA